MSSNIKPYEEQPTAPPVVTNAVITAGVAVLGDIAAAKGHVAESAALKASSPVVGYIAEHGHLWLGRRLHRVVEWASNVRERAREEGIEDGLTEVNDVVEQAIPVISRTADYTKRRMIEGIVLGAAREPDEHAARVEACYAIKIVDNLPDYAALVFAETAALLQNSSADTPSAPTRPRRIRRAVSRPYVHVSSVAERLPMPKFIFDKAQAALTNGSSPRLLTQGRSGNEVLHHAFAFTEEGEWLARWIAANPEPPPHPQPGR